MPTPIGAVTDWYPEYKCKDLWWMIALKQTQGDYCSK